MSSSYWWLVSPVFVDDSVSTLLGDINIVCLPGLQDRCRCHLSSYLGRGSDRFSHCFSLECLGLGSHLSLLWRYEGSHPSHVFYQMREVGGTRIFSGILGRIKRNFGWYFAYFEGIFWEKRGGCLRLSSRTSNLPCHHRSTSWIISRWRRALQESLLSLASRWRRGPWCESNSSLPGPGCSCTWSYSLFYWYREKSGSSLQISPFIAKSIPPCWTYILVMGRLQ